MGDSNSSRPGARPADSPPARTGAPTSDPAATAQEGSGAAAAGAPEKTGRVVHDERGNAVWDWVKDTTRIAVESTSRLLKKLEAPELQMEEQKDEGLRLEAERDAGGGYDPYQKITPSQGGSGGYDPFQKALMRKPPGRKA